MPTDAAPLSAEREMDRLWDHFLDVAQYRKTDAEAIRSARTAIEAAIRAPGSPTDAALPDREAMRSALMVAIDQRWGWRGPDDHSVPEDFEDDANFLLGVIEPFIRAASGSPEPVLDPERLRTALESAAVWLDDEAYLVNQFGAASATPTDAALVSGHRTGSGNRRHPEPVLDRPGLQTALVHLTAVAAAMVRGERTCSKGHRKDVLEHVHFEDVHHFGRLIANEVADLRAALATHASPAALVPEGDQG